MNLYQYTKENKPSKFRSVYYWNLPKEFSAQIYPEIQPYLSDNVWLAGGSLVDLLLEREPRDFDLFVRQNYSLNFTLEKLKRESKLVQIKNYNYEFENKVQLIGYSFFPTVAHLLDSFDLNVCTLAFDGKNLYSKNNTLPRRNDYLYSNIPHFNVKSINRYLKYTEKGFHSNMKDFLRLINEAATWKGGENVYHSGNLIISDYFMEWAKIMNKLPEDINKIIIKNLQSNWKLTPLETLKLINKIPFDKKHVNLF